MSKHSHMLDDPIIFTRDILKRYGISPKTLWKWRDSKKMPTSFKEPFPAPVVPGNPNRWRESDVLSWEARNVAGS
ncbi:helix-turn-helix transcriptional regulator [Pectobacterium carotovorum]|uniref:helix-turn-helix transcriptional regulator n=1 Tax=Pectobacterium carotovorum TaxID=554 RepID=UPI0039B6F97E